ncbi:MAG: NAD(P)/FAD-dependent oxidoreductase [Burkholderiales bacterium]|nr:NAD(P)/FAD-dependent oxidoreductase [Burkholderiales bacterium]
MDRIDCLVVGAGVVGLAVAKTLAEAGREVIVVDAADGIGSGTSSRNSEVIHAGLYYAPGSLKAELCVRGRRLLYAYCEAHGVEHRRCGKLIVATRDRDGPQLDAIVERARACGVTDLQRLTRAEALAMEPALACASALWSPSTGIVDSHAYMTALLGDAERAGAMLALLTPLLDVRREGNGWRVRTGGAEALELEATWIVNCAGLHAQAVAHRMQGFPTGEVPELHLAKGNYFSLRGRSPFTRLIYPTPGDGGLGVHLTLDLAGQARFGPDVEWLADADPDQVDYRVDEARAAAFEADIRRYWPGLGDDALLPAYSGIRPKLSGTGTAAADFHIAGPAEHGCPGVVQLFGIESPGLTASLAIGEEVRRRVAGGA